MRKDLINGAYCLLGELKGSSRPGLWLAHSLVTGELVTLALPAPDGESPTSVELKQEGDIFSEITHRHVQCVVDWSEEDVFLAWEYAPAWTLATVLRAAPPPSVGAVLRLMLELSHGLAAVHNRGAIYRGLNPSRILIMRDGTARLATTPEAVLAKRGRQIEAGPPRETPIRYLAPEQIQGAVTARTDLYSLAVVAYELLTGRQIYSHPDPVTLAVEILETSPPPPSAHRPDVPSDVDDFFVYCLARRADDRPRNVASMVTYLNKLLNTVGGPDIEPLAERLGLHPISCPLLASDRDRAELFQAVRSGFGDAVAARDDNGTEHKSVPEGEAKRRDAQTPSPEDESELDEDALELEDSESGPAQQTDGNARATAESLSWLAESDETSEAASEYLVSADGVEFALRRPGMTIGRRGSNGAKPDIDVRDLDSGMVVSREHAALHHHDGVWHVLELRATNGTSDNDERLVPGAEMPLRSGDKLRLANLELKFVVRASDEGDGHVTEGVESSDRLLSD